MIGGKTYTMGAIQQYAVEDLFGDPEEISQFTVSVSMIEIAGTKIQGKV